MAVLSFLATAQAQTVTGKVTSAIGPLPGVNVLVKGTTTGTLTDANGNYSLQASSGDVLVFTFIGYVSKEVPVGSTSNLNVFLEEDVKSLNEVVVTALGIKQEKRALNYSLQEVKSDEILKSREPNLVNALNSKVAGVQIISQAGTPGAAAAIYIRGKSSFLGNSQPLFVVDGIPVTNSFSTTNQSSSVDNANRAVDINPDDIETISVLKGPAAAALYGIQAASGVVLITTKKGSRSEGRNTTVTFSSNASVEQVNRYFPLQDEFAIGTGGNFNDAPGTTLVFGPRISELRYSRTLTDPRYLRGRIVPATDPTADPNAFVQTFDNQRNFYQTGRTYNNHLSISSGNQNGSFYFSVGRLSQQGVIPLNTFDRTTVKLTGESQLSSKLRISASASYINSGGRRVGRGDNFTGVVQGLYRTPRHFDIFNGQEDPTNPVAFQYINGSQRHYRNRDQTNGMDPRELGLGPDSPLWTINKNPYRDRVDRIIGYTQIDYQILPWLSTLFRVGADVFTDRRVHAFDIGSFGGDGRFGRIYEETYVNKTFNTDFIVTANKKWGKVGLTGLVGHNFFNNSETRSYLDGNIFNQPGFFNISNATIIANPQQATIRRRTFAAYTSVKADYLGWAYLEGTLRNEWVSTLEDGNNSFLFPSISAGLILTDAFQIEQSVLSYAKVRASFAEVGNTPPPYQTQTFYGRASATDGFGNGISFPLRSTNTGGSTLSDQIGNPDLKPEINATLEGGLDIGFWQNRVRLDFTYYYSRTRNQIVNVPLATSSGFANLIINAGELENKGIEAILTVVPVQSDNFRWEASFNFTRNRNKVLSTFNDAPVQLPGFGTIFQPSLVRGEQFGVFYGTGWRRDSQGRIVIGDDGFPIRQDNILVGNPNPDFLLGIRNTVSYKSLTLSFLWDIRQGGDVWNGTEAVLTNIGMTTRTLARGQQRVFEGVRLDGSPNTQAVTLTQANWFQANGRATGAAGVHEQFVEDASWIRLRDVNLSYTLPKKWFGKTVVKGVELTAYGRNLLLFTKYSGIDPETSLFGVGGSQAVATGTGQAVLTGTAQGLDYFGNPNTRSIGVGLNATF